MGLVAGGVEARVAPDRGPDRPTRVSSPGSVDEAEIEQAYAGGERAQRELVSGLLPIVHRAVVRRLFPLARARGRDPRHELDDFVSGVFVRLLDDDWRVLRAFDSSRGSIESYVSTVADRHVLSEFRVRARDPYAEIPVDTSASDAQLRPVSDFEGQVRAREILDELYAFLEGRLSERGLLLFRLLEVECLPVAEVCERAQMSTAAVYQWRSRLRRLIQEWRDTRTSGGGVRLQASESNSQGRTS